MRARVLAATALIAAAAVTPHAASADAGPCPGASTGGYSAGVCDELVVTPTGNTGYTVSGNVPPYCSVPGTVLCQMLVAPFRAIVVGATGADVNGSTPPVPTYDPATGQVSAPAGTVATVFVHGTPYGVDTPAYCVTTNVRC